MLVPFVVALPHSGSGLCPPSFERRQYLSSQWRVGHACPSKYHEHRLLLALAEWPAAATIGGLSTVKCLMLTTFGELGVRVRREASSVYSRRLSPQGIKGKPGLLQRDWMFQCRVSLVTKACLEHEVMPGREVATCRGRLSSSPRPRHAVSQSYWRERMVAVPVAT